jgi:flagellar biosynthesis/type III secretory pathway protein FliH
MSSAFEKIADDEFLENERARQAYNNGLNKGRKQGAVEELERIQNIISDMDFSKLNTSQYLQVIKFINIIFGYAENKIKELRKVK